MNTIVKSFKIGDLFVGIAIIVIVAILLLSVTVESGEKYANIYKDGELQFKHNLAVDGRYKCEGMVIIIEGAAAYVLEADCDDKICVKSGKIEQPHEMIVCLPKRIAIIISTNVVDNKGVDTIAK